MGVSLCLEPLVRLLEHSGDLFFPSWGSDHELTSGFTLELWPAWRWVRVLDSVPLYPEPAFVPRTQEYAASPQPCVPLCTPNRSSKPKLETKNYIWYVDNWIRQRSAGPQAHSSHATPPPWAPEIGTTASSSSSLPSSRDSGATMGWGPIGTTQTPAPDMGADGGPGPPTEDSSLSLWRGRHLSRAGAHARGTQETLSKSKKYRGPHLRPLLRGFSPAAPPMPETRDEQRH